MGMWYGITALFVYPGVADYPSYEDMLIVGVMGKCGITGLK
jgi:hypothetical protein